MFEGHFLPKHYVIGRLDTVINPSISFFQLQVRLGPALNSSSWGQFHQLFTNSFYFLLAQIPKVQKDSQVISVFWHYWDLHLQKQLVKLPKGQKRKREGFDNRTQNSRVEGSQFKPPGQAKIYYFLLHSPWHSNTRRDFSFFT